MVGLERLRCSGNVVGMYLIEINCGAPQISRTGARAVRAKCVIFHQNWWFCRVLGGGELWLVYLRNRMRFEALYFFVSRFPSLLLWDTAKSG